MIDTPTIQPGTRVLIKGDHPWAGHTGEFLRFEKTPFGECPRIRLDNGHECFVMKPNEWGPALAFEGKAKKKRR